MTGAMSPDEALAVARLRQWCFDRLSLASARTCEYQRHGWQQRNDRTFDARLVRVIDFGRALGKLDAEEQAALVLTYRDRQRLPETARALCCSTRKVAYLVPAARRKLAAWPPARSVSRSGAPCHRYARQRLRFAPPERPHFPLRGRAARRRRSSATLRRCAPFVAPGFPPRAAAPCGAALRAEKAPALAAPHKEP